MGLLVNGQWTDRWYDTKKTGGHFKRGETAFRNWITADGAAGPTGSGGFKAEAGRYHLYVSYACPWAHRALIVRALKGLEEMISLSVTHWFMGDQGWTFQDGPGVIADPINAADYLHQVYTAAQSDFTGRSTVPILWDRETGSIVSNESSEIIRMLNGSFDEIGARAGDYYPEAQRAEIDQVNARIYDTLNNGVYKCGFATSQEAYDAAVSPLFETLEWLEERLSSRRYLVGAAPTEADWRLFPTLYRFDAVYNGHFKCSKRRLIDYSNLWAYTRDLYQHPGIAGTVNMDHVRKHYYQSHETVNPTRIVPAMPASIDFSAPHDRASLAASGRVDR
ncbi:MAG: glutathione S-transferase family protein [Pseudomonadota bacterium]